MVVAILAVAQALVIFSRNIDLSVGSIVGVAAYLTGDFLGTTGAGPTLGMLVAIAVGAVLGSINGGLVAYGGVPAIIVTLGTLALFRTLLSIYSGGANILAGDLPAWVLEFNNVTLFSVGGFEIRLVFVIALVVVIALHWSFGRLRWGRASTRSAPTHPQPPKQGFPPPLSFSGPSSVPAPSPGSPGSCSWRGRGRSAQQRARAWSSNRWPQR